MKCKYCDIEILNRVHIRWCKKNPNVELNKQRQSIKTAEKASEVLKKAWADGAYINKKYSHTSTPHTEESKKKISEGAKKSSHRRLVKSCRNYTMKNGIVILLDSSWEEIMAQRLDELN